MTNEEKIQQLLNEPCWESKPYLIGMDKIGVEDVMERFAEWKDEQYNEEKRDLLGLVKMLKIDEHNQTIIEDLVAILNL